MNGLEGHLVGALLTVRAHLHEMEVRRNYSNDELLGHFCTELRRRLTVPTLHYRANVYDSRMWEAPFTPSRYSAWNNVEVVVGSTTHKVTKEYMTKLCETVKSMSDEELEVSNALGALALDLPAIQRRAVEAERHTRSMEQLSKEITTYVGGING